MIKNVLDVNARLLRKNNFKIETINDNIMIGVNENYAMVYDCRKMLLKIIPHNKSNINNILIKYTNNFKKNIRGSHNLTWSSEQNDKDIKICVHKTETDNIEISKLILKSL